MPNQITIIKPYRWQGVWVFDDERVGLNKEPFVGGADSIIDAAVALKGIAHADRGFLLLFSAEPFPGADMQLEWVREESGGNVYRWQDREGWLCPALLRYFDSPPERIFVQVKEAAG
jgi:hypothetical protein